MSVQRLHSQLAPIDVLTREEMSAEIHSGLDAWLRERYRGLEIQRFPRVIVSATGTPVQIFSSNNETPIGPEQGDIWMVRRIIVKSSLLTDGAHYWLFRGTTPSDPGQYTALNLLEGFATAIPAVTQPTPPAITVGASPFSFMNVQPYTVLVTVSGGTVSAITINGTNVGATSGTFALTTNSVIQVTYTVAPTMTEVNANANIPGQPAGLNVNIGYYPGTKAVFLQPGEQIFAQVNAATVGNQYLLEGEAIRVPAEMKGKVL